MENFPYYNYFLADLPNFFWLRFVTAINVNTQTILTYESKMADVSNFAMNNPMSLFSEDYSFLPMAVRYAIPEKNFYVVERPPFQIEVDFSPTRSYNQRKTVKSFDKIKMWIPWTVSIIKYSVNPIHFSFNLYFNDKPLQSLDDLLLHAYTPNVSAGQVCLGEDSRLVGQKVLDNAPFVDIFNEIFNSYFNGWNSDLASNFVYNDFIANKVNEILSVKKPPFKNFDTSANSWITYKKHHLRNVLYVMSHFSLQEVLEYVSHTKQDPTIKRPSSVPGRSPVTYPHYKPFTLRSLLKPYDNMVYTGFGDAQVRKSNLFSSMFDQLSTHTILSNMKSTVYIENLFQEEAPTYINNPFLTAKMYEAHAEHHMSELLKFANGSHVRFASKEFYFNAEELQSYNMTGDKDVHSS